MEARQPGLCAEVIAGLAPAKEHPGRTANGIRDGVELRVQAAFRAPDEPTASLFCARLEAVRCVFRWVLSIICVSLSCSRNIARHAA